MQIIRNLIAYDIPPTKVSGENRSEILFSPDVNLKSLHFSFTDHVTFTTVRFGFVSIPGQVAPLSFVRFRSGAKVLGSVGLRGGSVGLSGSGSVLGRRMPFEADGEFGAPD
jgi:hypothetical protein